MPRRSLEEIQNVTIGQSYNRNKPFLQILSRDQEYKKMESGRGVRLLQGEPLCNTLYAWQEDKYFVVMKSGEIARFN